MGEDGSASFRALFIQVWQLGSVRGYGLQTLNRVSAYLSTPSRQHVEPSQSRLLKYAPRWTQSHSWSKQQAVCATPRLMEVTCRYNLKMRCFLKRTFVSSLSRSRRQPMVNAALTVVRQPPKAKDCRGVVAQRGY